MKNGRILTELPLLQLLLHKFYMEHNQLEGDEISAALYNRNYDCFSTRPKEGCCLWDLRSQSSVFKDQNLLGYYVVSDGKQLLTFCTCTVPSSLESNSPTRVFFCHLLSLTVPAAQDIIIWNQGNCLPVDMA